MRGAGFVWSPLLKKSSRVSKQMMNIEDWLPTLYSVAGGAESDLPPLLDGFDMWKALSEDLPSPRNLILHNIDETRHIASLRVGDWKLVKGTLQMFTGKSECRDFKFMGVARYPKSL